MKNSRGFPGRLSTFLPFSRRNHNWICSDARSDAAWRYERESLLVYQHASRVCALDHNRRHRSRLPRRHSVLGDSVPSTEESRRVEESNKRPVRHDSGQQFAILQGFRSKPHAGLDDSTARNVTEWMAMLLPVT